MQNPRSSPGRTQAARSRLIETCVKSPDQKHQHQAHKLKQCGKLVQWVNAETGEVGQGKSHCDLRICPSCQARKQRKAVRELRRWAGKAVKQKEKLDFLFLSVAFSNVPAQDVGYLHQTVNGGFKRLQHRSAKWPGLGAINSKEFTVGDDGLVHYHTHSLIAVPATYFNAGNYLEQQGWAEEIQRTFKLSYQPVVNIKKVRGGNPQAVVSNLIYVFDYMLKPQDYSHPEVGLLLADQLHGTRRISYAGLFRTLKAAAKSARPVVRGGEPKTNS